MADSPNMIELRVQELVFLAYLFLHPEELGRYAGFLNQAHILTTLDGRTVWDKMYTYYNKYGALPSREAMRPAGFTDTEINDLNMAMAAISDDEVDARFILDTFPKTLEMNVFKWSMAEMEKAFTGSPDLALAKLQEVEQKLFSQLSLCRNALTGTEISHRQTIDDWFMDKLEMQKPRLPVPIEGIADKVMGTPLGTVNMLVGSYGVGKTTVLSSMTAFFAKLGLNILYVTLETHENVIAFKVTSNLTRGKVKSSTVFEEHASVRVSDTERQLLRQFITVGGSQEQPVLEDDDNSDEEEDTVRQRLKKIVIPTGVIDYLSMSPGEATPAQLERYVREIQRRDGVKFDVLIIDYAALMKTNAGGTREDIGWSYTGTIVMELVAVAKKLGIVIWTAAQAGGDKAHTVTSSNFADFKPLRGADIYGSKEILQNGAMVFGMSFIRSSRYPQLAAGVLSIIKNRYGVEFYDFLCTLNYAQSNLAVKNVLLSRDISDTVNQVHGLCQELEFDYNAKVSPSSSVGLKAKDWHQKSSAKSNGGRVSTRIDSKTLAQMYPECQLHPDSPSDSPPAIHSEQQYKVTSLSSALARKEAKAKESAGLPPKSTQDDPLLESAWLRPKANLPTPTSKSSMDT